MSAIATSAIAHRHQRHRAIAISAIATSAIRPTTAISAGHYRQPLQPPHSQHAAQLASFI
jgi:hypothetical protein